MMDQEKMYTLEETKSMMDASRILGYEEGFEDGKDEGDKATLAKGVALGVLGITIYGFVSKVVAKKRELDAKKKASDETTFEEIHDEDD